MHGGIWLGCVLATKSCMRISSRSMATMAERKATIIQIMHPFVAHPVGNRSWPHAGGEAADVCSASDEEADCSVDEVCRFYSL